MGQGRRKGCREIRSNKSQEARAQVAELTQAAYLRAVEAGKLPAGAEVELDPEWVVVSVLEPAAEEAEEAAEEAAAEGDAEGDAE
mgnify:CR=1 FL=1